MSTIKRVGQLRTLPASAAFCLWAATLALPSVCMAQGKQVLYQNNFEKAELDKLPEGFVILDGTFTVQQADGNRFLELPGAPLDTFGVLFGPKDQSDVEVSARIYGTAKGRRYPVFAVGLAGVSGFRLQVSPAKRALELYRGDTLKAAVPFEWESGKWTHLRLQYQKTSGGWKAAGKVWTEGQNEPAAWMISTEHSEALTPGQASLFGSPFSGTPIRFDDVVISRVSRSGP